jgi:hypothetical protein
MPTATAAVMFEYSILDARLDRERPDPPRALISTNRTVATYPTIMYQTMRCHGTFE